MRRGMAAADPVQPRRECDVTWSDFTLTLGVLGGVCFTILLGAALWDWFRDGRKVDE